VEDNLAALRNSGQEISRGMLKGVIIRKQNLEVRLKTLNTTSKTEDDDVVDFKMMGIDHLFVDESHQFKNLMPAMTGLQAWRQYDGSQTMNLLLPSAPFRIAYKEIWATFLSGTTISNSLANYLLFKYLRPEHWKKQGIN
jgi:N12 class adenine-specific DNA methylase